MTFEEWMGNLSVGDKVRRARGGVLWTIASIATQPDGLRVLRLHRVGPRRRQFKTLSTRDELLMSWGSTL